MNELNIENLEWLLMVAMEERGECQAIIDNLEMMFAESLTDLEKTYSYNSRLFQMNNANICIAVISEEILKLKINPR